MQTEVRVNKFARASKTKSYQMTFGRRLMSKARKGLMFVINKIIWFCEYE